MIQFHLLPQWARMITVWQDDGFGNVVHVSESALAVAQSSLANQSME